MTKRCVALYSGGLDSILALLAMVRQGLEVIAFHGVSVFHGEGDGPAHMDAVRARVAELGAAGVEFRNMNEPMLALTRAPRFGYGKHLNACLDCRIATIAAAHEVMQEVGAGFLVSGEVVGQRPMSQRREAMNCVTREISKRGLDGLLLRPLCAKQLEPTIPEQEGWVDREQLFDFHGRSRKPQIALAAEWGIADYPGPAGGCLLTDGGFSFRLQELMEQQPAFTLTDVRLLRIGRHFRVGGCKIIASRREAEGDELIQLATPADRLFLTQEKPGAMILLREAATDEAERIAAGLAVYYSKFREDGAGPVETWRGDQSEDQTVFLGTIDAIDPLSLGEAYLLRPE